MGMADGMGGHDLFLGCRPDRARRRTKVDAFVEKGVFDIGDVRLRIEEATHAGADTQRVPAAAARPNGTGPGGLATEVGEGFVHHAPTMRVQSSAAGATVPVPPPPPAPPAPPPVSLTPAPIPPAASYAAGLFSWVWVMPELSPGSGLEPICFI